MTTPYHIEGPALISFSGGRTSAYMLRQILDAYGGRLPDGIVPTFANRGSSPIRTKTCGSVLCAMLRGWLIGAESSSGSPPR
jgi:hypothetical protein